MSKLKYLLILLLFSSCLTQKNVTLKNIENINYSTENNSPVLNFDLVIHNPNNWGLRVSDIDTKVSVEDRTIGNTKLPKTIKIKRNSDISVPMQLNLSMDDIISFLPQGLSLFTGKKTTVKTSVDGGITLRKFIFKKRLAININQQLELK